MTTPPTDDTTRHRRMTIAIVGSAILVVLAVTLVLLMGLRYVPEFSTIRETPEPNVTGRLAIQNWTEDEGTCLDIEELETGVRKHVFCDGRPQGALASLKSISWFNWSADGKLMLASYQQPTIRLITYDVDSSTILKEATLPTDTPPPDMRTRADGSTLSTKWRSNGHAEVLVNAPDGSRRTLYETRGPDEYAFVSAEWSRRGNFAVVRDSEGRWIVLHVNGDPVPRILASEADQVAWYQP